VRASAADPARGRENELPPLLHGGETKIPNCETKVPGPRIRRAKRAGPRRRQSIVTLRATRAARQGKSTFMPPRDSLPCVPPDKRNPGEPIRRLHDPALVSSTGPGDE